MNERKAIARSQKVLITGGAGFIGSRLTEQLLEAGTECLVIDNLSVGLPEPASRDALRFERLDIRDGVALEKAGRDFRPDVIVHLAAIHHIPTCEKDPQEAYRVNVLGFQAVLDAATASECGRIVLASSGAVYDWRDEALKENDTPLKPHDVYSLSKFIDEHQLRLWTERTGGAGTVARIFNTIGKNDPNAHLIPDILRQMQTGRNKAEIRLGNIHTRRDYIYVEDTAAGLLSMTLSPVSAGVEIFNLGTGVESDVEKLVQVIAGIKGIECTIVIDPARVRKVDRQSQKADITQARIKLHWKPKRDFQEAIRLAVE